MVYVFPNFKSKAALKAAVKAGQTVTVSNTGPLSNKDTNNGRFAAAGPHFPAAHKWYAEVTVVGGKVVKVK